METGPGAVRGVGAMHGQPANDGTCNGDGVALRDGYLAQFLVSTPLGAAGVGLGEWADGTGLRWLHV